MHGYVTTEALVLDTNRQYKAIPAVSSLDAAEIGSVQLEAGEFDLVKRKLGEKFSPEEIAQKLRLARDEDIAHWEFFPPRLGRVSLGLLERAKTFDHSNEIDPLRQQLALLKSRTPSKTHYRFALVNGFGGNLGDALIGITAFRAVADVLSSELPSFSVDILHGWTTNPATRDLFAHEKYIQNVFTSGLTLTEFSLTTMHILILVG